MWIIIIAIIIIGLIGRFIYNRHKQFKMLKQYKNDIHYVPMIADVYYINTYLFQHAFMYKLSEKGIERFELKLNNPNYLYKFYKRHQIMHTRVGIHFLYKNTAENLDNTIKNIEAMILLVNRY